MIVNYKAGMLKHATTGRFHPIVFHPAPLPGSVVAPSGALRYKSRGHHTAGFATYEEALASIKEKGFVWTDNVWEWDGTEDGAVMVEWFPVNIGPSTPGGAS